MNENNIFSINKDDVNQEVWTAIDPSTLPKRENPNVYNAIKIEDGLKVCVREDLMKQFISEKGLLDKFDLNIKRRNRWYWSIAFKTKVAP